MGINEMLAGVKNFQELAQGMVAYTQGGMGAEGVVLTSVGFSGMKVSEADSRVLEGLLDLRHNGIKAGSEQAVVAQFGITVAGSEKVDDFGMEFSVKVHLDRLPSFKLVGPDLKAAMEQDYRVIAVRAKAARLKRELVDLAHEERRLLEEYGQGGV